MTVSQNIVVFTGDLTYSVRRGIVELDRAIPGLSWLILCERRPRAAGRLLRNQWRNLRRNGWRWIPYQLGDIRARMSHPRAAATDAPGNAWTLSAIKSRPNMSILYVEDLHEEAALEAVRAFKPTLGLSLAAPILRKPLFSIPVLGTLNLHKGRVPDYRGMPPAFWELWNDDTAVGVTVHRVDEKLDTGDIVATATVQRADFSTLRGLQLQLDEAGVQLTIQAARSVLNGESVPVAQPPGGKTYRKPTLSQVATLERRLARLQPTSASLAKRIVRGTAAASTVRLWRAGVGSWLSPRITVVLYHRVSDDARDNLTVGVEKFDRQMALLRQYCQPISIEAALANEIVPKSDRPLVAVSFDDGYLDNYENAAPILMRNGIPAAFFVSTGMIGTDRRFPHDVRRGNAPIPTMQWDQLRRMRDWGFTIGSHSVSHIDCASEPEDRVRAELAQSRDDLGRELGIKEPLFAYPYGSRRHMTPQRLELVKQAGYRACLAAYGGSNVRTIDRFNVLRKGIHWGFSDDAFLFECLGLR
jgi:peptidoglycan/xylan/chitin deacetylase (PgdA/CDA1 family)